MTLCFSVALCENSKQQSIWYFMILQEKETDPNQPPTTSEIWYGDYSVAIFTINDTPNSINALNSLHFKNKCIFSSGECI